VEKQHWDERPAVRAGNGRHSPMVAWRRIILSSSGTTPGTLSAGTQGSALFVATSKAEQVNDPVRDDDVLGQHGGPRLGLELGGEPHPDRPVGGAQVLRHVGGGQGLEQVSAIRNQFVTA
jgi:hypothetical protein